MRTILNTKCPYCKKPAKEKNREEIDGEIWLNLECGHIIVKDMLKPEDIQIVSSDGKVPFPFQHSPTGLFTLADGSTHESTVSFLERADCNGLCLHEMGLGKTVIECILLARNPQLLPALIVVKSGLRAQWFMEIFRWTGKAAQVITSSRELPLFDYFDIVIISIDTLRLVRPDVKVVSEFDMIVSENAGKKIGPRPIIWTDEICAKFKHIAIDESQKIKNSGSARTQALRKIVSASENQGGTKPRVICYSGTNIEKHAGEFFVTLNLTRPELFPNESVYQRAYCDIDPETGKIQGLRNPERFKERTKDFIIRYKRDNVLPDLPKIFRQFRLAELEGGELQAYIKVVKEFQERMDDPEHPMIPTEILGYLSKMRHITGIAKTKSALVFIEEFLLESERKLVIFLHHKMAGSILMKDLEKLCREAAFNPPLQLHSDLDMNQRVAVIEEFRKPGNRLLVASTLASGEGLNLQFCQDCLIMERQWNPAAEEQAEARFPRPRPDDPWPPGARINAHYLIAAGTIDDFLTDIIETKRSNVAQTLDGEEIQWNEDSIIAELAKVLQTKGLKKWKL